jgi:hypothetical protein
VVTGVVRGRGKAWSGNEVSSTRFPGRRRGGCEQCRRARFAAADPAVWSAVGMAGRRTPPAAAHPQGPLAAGPADPPSRPRTRPPLARRHPLAGQPRAPGPLQSPPHALRPPPRPRRPGLPAASLLIACPLPRSHGRRGRRRPLRHRHRWAGRGRAGARARALPGTAAGGLSRRVGRAGTGGTRGGLFHGRGEARRGGAGSRRRRGRGAATAARGGGGAAAGDGAAGADGGAGRKRGHGGSHPRLSGVQPPAPPRAQCGAFRRDPRVVRAAPVRGAPPGRGATIDDRRPTTDHRPPTSIIRHQPSRVAGGRSSVVRQNA